MNLPQSDAGEVPDSAEIEQQDLATIRRDLQQYRSDLSPWPHLLKATTEWLVAARSLPAASAAEHISDRFMQLSQGYPMYRTPGTSDGQDRFPDDCEGCPHYEEGAACPILADYRNKRQMREIMNSISNPQRRRRELRRLATKHECHILAEALDEVTTDYQPLLQRGLIIWMLVEDVLLHPNAEADVKHAVATLAPSVAVSPEDFSDLKHLRGDPEAGLFEPRDEPVTPEEIDDEQDAVGVAD